MTATTHVRPAPLADGTHTTTCWECSANCGALAKVRDGRVVEYGPNAEAPHSKGAFCIKGIRGAPGLTYNPNRLLYPHKRVGARGEGKWARISWDEALDEMADRLADVRRRHGPEAIVGATSGANFSRSLIMALMLRSIGSPNWMINQDLCGGCRAVSARTTGLDIQRGEDIEHTRCALIVGRNSSVADPIEWAALKAAKKRGARLIVIDPRTTALARSADIHLAVSHEWKSFDKLINGHVFEVHVCSLPLIDVIQVNDDAPVGSFFEFSASMSRIHSHAFPMRSCAIGRSSRPSECVDFHALLSSR